MIRDYLVRFGTLRHVGRFRAEGGSAYDRGAIVVLQSARGTELGEVLAEISHGQQETPPLLRAASAHDLVRADRAEADRPRRFQACERLLGDGAWPLELIDVEPLLDEARTVVHYLGPHRLDTAGLRQALIASCAIDPVFQPVGRDEPAEPEPSGCGSCSQGGCGTGGGCGDGGGCSGCGVKSALTRGHQNSARNS